MEQLLFEKTISINNKKYTFPKSLFEKSKILSSKTKSDFFIEHHLFEISRQDIEIAFNFVLNQFTLNYTLFHDVAVVKFILTYFEFDNITILNLQVFVIENYNKLKNKTQLFIYDPKLNITLKDNRDDIDYLLEYGFSLKKILKKFDTNILIDILFFGEHIKYSGYSYKINKDLSPNSEKLINSNHIINLNKSIKTDYSHALISDQKYKIGEKILKQNLDLIKNDLKLFTHSILEEIEWNNVALCGDYLSLILNSNFNLEDFPETNIDLFVYGKTSEIITNTINNLISKLKKKFEIAVFQDGLVIKIVVKNISFKRNIQIINSTKSYLFEILNNFDLSSSKIAFDGKNFLCTSDYIISCIDQTVFIDKTIFLPRIVKNKKMGLTILFNKNTNLSNLKDLLDKDVTKDENVIRLMNKYFIYNGESDERLSFCIKLYFENSFKSIDTIKKLK